MGFFIKQPLLPPLLLLAAVTAQQRTVPLAGTLQVNNRHAWRAFWLMPVIALLYTTPWDNYLLWRGIWGYPLDRVIGYLGYVPYEEYVFFVVLSLLAGLWLYWCLRNTNYQNSAHTNLRWPVTAVGLFLMGIGVALLFAERGRYLGLIFTWAMPVISLQWALGGDLLSSLTRLRISVILPLSIYLSMADRFAISQGIWEIYPKSSTGLMILGLPIEEALFFLLTTIIVVDGLLLFIHPVMLRRVLRKPPLTSVSAD